MGNVVSFDGFDLRQSGVNAFIVGWGGEPTRSNNFAERARSTTVFSSARYETLQFTIAVEFINVVEPTLSTLRRKVVGWFLDNANYQKERMLVIEDGSELYYRPCAVVKLTEPHRTIVQFEMEAGHPTWIAMQPTDLGRFPIAALGSTSTLAINTGSSISVRPQVTADLQPSTGAYQRFKRSYEITSFSSSAIRNEPIMLELGDTSTWVSSGKARPNGVDIEAVLDGRGLRKKLLNFGSMKTHLWVTIPYLASGGQIIVDVLYGSSTKRGLDMIDYYHPAFAIAGSYGGCRAGSTTSLIQVYPQEVADANTLYAASQLVGGYLEFVTGANAGLVRKISANTARTEAGTPTITVATPFTYAPALNDKWVAYLSDNQEWLYMTTRDNRVSGNYNKAWGGWYIAKPNDSGPSDVRFGDVVPGAWNRFLYQDNNDDKSQSSNLYATPYRYAILDAKRRRSSDKVLREEGAFDGVILSTGVPIISLTCDYRFKNPASTGAFGQAKAKILYQMFGGDEWSTLHENSAVYATEYTAPATTYSIFPDRATQIAFALVGMNVTKNESDQVVSIEGEISTTNSDKSVSTLSWGNTLRVTREFNNNIVIRDANDELSPLYGVPEEYAIREMGLEITLNGGNMLNQRIPFGGLPTSYQEITSGPYERLYIGPQYVTDAIYSANTLYMDELNNNIVIDASSRSATLHTKSGSITNNDIIVGPVVKSIPWVARAVTGSDIAKYASVEATSSEWLRIPPDTSYRAPGHELGLSGMSTTYWTRQEADSPMSLSLEQLSGPTYTQGLTFTPTGTSELIAHISNNAMLPVIPGDTFRWSAKVFVQPYANNGLRIFLSTGFSASNAVNTQEAFPIDLDSVTALRDFPSLDLVSWQGVVPAFANYAKLYVIVMYYSSVSASRRFNFGDILINGNYLKFRGTRDVAYANIKARKEFL